MRAAHANISFSRIISEIGVRGHIAALVLGGVTVHGLVYSSYLPEEVPSHFDGAGNIDATSSKQTLVGLYVGISWAIVVLFTAILAMIPCCMNSCPSSINTPEREYWLAPERRLKWLGILGKFFAMHAILILFLLFFIFQLSFSTAMGQLESTSTRSLLFWIALIVFLVLTFVNVMYLLMQLKNVPRHEGPRPNQAAFYRPSTSSEGQVSVAPSSYAPDSDTRQLLA